MQKDAFKILNALFTYCEGTLWYVREELTKERADVYDQNSDRIGHPFVSIRKKPIVGNEKIPMVIGSHKKRRKNDFMVHDVMYSKSVTWFGSKIIPFKADDFLSKTKIATTKKNRSNKLITERKPIIEKNPRKSKLDSSEMKLLKEWKKKEGYKI